MILKRFNEDIEPSKIDIEYLRFIFADFIEENDVSEDFSDTFYELICTEPTRGFQRNHEQLDTERIIFFVEKQLKFWKDVNRLVKIIQEEEKYTFELNSDTQKHGATDIYMVIRLKTEEVINNRKVMRKAP